MSSPTPPTRCLLLRVYVSESRDVCGCGASRVAGGASSRVGGKGLVRAGERRSVRAGAWGRGRGPERREAGRAGARRARARVAGGCRPGPPRCFGFGRVKTPVRSLCGAQGVVADRRLCPRVEKQGQETLDSGGGSSGGGVGECGSLHIAPPYAVSRSPLESSQRLAVV